jgi:hypothetical protein
MSSAQVKQAVDEKKALEAELKALQTRPSLKESADQVLGKIQEKPDPLADDENVWKKEIGSTSCCKVS